MDEIGFGEILRQTRERKGLGLNATARRLRIRPDILRAIEDGNFAAMPPRGYTRNMVNGYARYLGLNPTEITGMFIEELYAYQASLSQQHRRSSGIDMPDDVESSRLSRRSSSRLSRTQGRTDHTSSRTGRSRSEGAASQTHRTRQNGSYVGGLTGADTYITQNSRSTRRFSDESSERGEGGFLSRIPFVASQYTGASSISSNTSARSIAPFIIGAAVLLLIVVLIWLFFFHGRGQSSNTAVETMPVTTVSQSQSSDTSSDSETESNQTGTTSSESAPDHGTFEYTIAQGSSTYLEIYVDGTRQTAGDVNGPASGSYDFTDSLKLVCSERKAISVKINGEAVTLEENAKGIVNTTYRFSDILAEWEKTHSSVRATSTATSASS